MVSFQVCSHNIYQWWLISILAIALSFASRQELLNVDMDVDNTEGKHSQGECEWEDIEGSDAGLYWLPPGEEGMFHSHAGGEVVIQDIVDSIHSRHLILFLPSNKF